MREGVVGRVAGERGERQVEREGWAGSGVPYLLVQRFEDRLGEG